jgi:hypothetical protein
MKSPFSLAELEAAINYWRMRSPAQGEERALCPQASALAEPYALMIFNGQQEIAAAALGAAARAALAAWHEQADSANEA